MFDHFKINVAQRDGTHWDGRPRFVHFFATAPESCRDREKADAVLIALRARFPEEEGFQITMTHWVCRGHEVQA